MKALITGGAGFIGSHLAEELLRRGERVTVIDDLSTGSSDNIEHLLNRPDFHFVRDTILDEAVMRRLVDNAEVVYHLAAAVGVKYVIDNPLQSIQTNIRGTEIVLELAAREKKKVLLASTSEVYGKNSTAVFPESADIVIGSTTISRWSYACSKAMDEFLALAYHRAHGLPVTIARFFNTCGPRQVGRYGMVIPRFVRQALLGRPITVHGDGKQTRSFTYVSDAVDAVIELANHPAAVGEIFNIGNPDGITIEELAFKIKAMTDSPSKIVYVPYNQVYADNFEDMRYRVPDVTKIHSLTGLVPKVKLDEILRRVIEHAASRLEFPEPAASR